MKPQIKNKCNTTEDFIRKSINIHNNKYDYSKSVYINAKTKICIICKLHGEFWQLPNNHYKKTGCPHCAGNKNRTIEEFIKEARKIHGNVYDYSNAKKSNHRVNIICKLHGESIQIAGNHLQGKSMSKCFGTPKSNKEEFIKKSRVIHGNLYDYGLVDYKTNKIKIKIICKKHGIFKQRPDNHINIKAGCPKCKYEIYTPISKGEMKYLEYVMAPHRQQYFNGYYVDGIDYINKIIYEFLG